MGLSTYYGPVCVLLLADQYDVIIYYVKEVLSVIQSPSISKYDTYLPTTLNFTSVYYFHFKYSVPYLPTYRLLLLHHHETNI